MSWKNILKEEGLWVSLSEAGNSWLNAKNVSEEDADAMVRLVRSIVRKYKKPYHYKELQIDRNNKNLVFDFTLLGIDDPERYGETQYVGSKPKTSEKFDKYGDEDVRFIPLVSELTNALEEKFSHIGWY
tara:strand:- start:132 stop:518 length:387 start_codon:yes stop_codon:yes gene_type:complete